MSDQLVGFHGMVSNYRFARWEQGFEKVRPIQLQSKISRTNDWCLTGLRPKCSTFKIPRSMWKTKRSTVSLILSFDLETRSDCSSVQRCGSSKGFPKRPGLAKWSNEGLTRWWIRRLWWLWDYVTLPLEDYLRIDFRRQELNYYEKRSIHYVFPY